MAQRLGDILLQQGAVTADKLAAALSDQRAFGGRLGRTLVDLGYATEDAVLRALATQLGLQQIDMHQVQPDEAALGAVTVSVCERYGIFPVRLDARERVLWLATAEPDLHQLQEVAQITQLTLEPVLAPLSAIERAVRSHYYGEAAGHAKKPRKGEPLRAIPHDSGLPTERPPPGKLPSSAGPLHDPDAPHQQQPHPLPQPEVRAVEDEPPEAEEVEPLDAEPAGAAHPDALERAQQAAAAHADAAAQAEASAPPAEVLEPEALPPEGLAADPDPGATPLAEAASFDDFAQLEPEPEQLHAIAPGSHPPDAIEELQRLVLRLEQLVSAQSRAFRALVELLQEKGVVRRGELGLRTNKKE